MKFYVRLLFSCLLLGEQSINDQQPFYYAPNLNLRIGGNQHKTPFAPKE